MSENSGMFTEIIEVNEKESTFTSSGVETKYNPISKTTIKVPHNNGVLGVCVPPIGYKDYYSLARESKKVGRGLNAFELSSLLVDSWKNPNKTYSTNGYIDGFNEVITSDRINLSPKETNVGHILRNEHNFSFTGLIYIPESQRILNSNGGAIVFDFYDPEVQFNLVELVERLRAGNDSVRFVPGNEIYAGRDYTNSGVSSDIEHRALTADQFVLDPLANAILRSGAHSLTEIKTDEGIGNFHIYYHHPGKISSLYPAVVSMTINGGSVRINASNKSIGNKGFDSFSRHDLLKKGFLHCAV